MANFEEQGGKTQKRVPNWKKLLSLKNSGSAVPIEHFSKIEKLKKKESHIDHSFKTIEKKRKKDKSKDDEVSKVEEKKKKTNKHREKKQKVNYKEEDNDRNENEKLSMDDSNSVLKIEQTKLKIPEEFIHTAKAGSLMIDKFLF